MLRATLIWGALVLAIAGPVVLAAASPLLAWRDAIYIAGGFAGILALALMLLQPLLAAGLLPGKEGFRGRKLHKWIGIGLVTLVVLHVGGLWLTSPPDVVDALLLRSPTPFAVWGVAAMWALFTTAAWAAYRHRLRPRIWRRVHGGLALVITSGTALHAILIQGAMETLSKVLLCIAVMVATLVILHRRGLLLPKRPTASPR